jgi:hypothetical protein
MPDTVDILHGLELVDKQIGDMLTALKPAEQKRILRDIGRHIRKSQSARIARQENPDGTPYKPRKRDQAQSKRLHAKKFLYPEHGSGAPRLVYMKSWRYDGRNRLTGFDLKASAERTFDRDKIIRYLPLAAGEDNGTAGTYGKPTVRQRAMFRKIRLNKWMKVWLDADGLHIGYSGRVARIARSHQEGLDRHPIRQLVGFTATDREEILSLLLSRLKA